MGMGDAEEGFVVLVHIPVGRGRPYRETYLVACSNHAEAEARIKDLYPREPNMRMYVSPLHVCATKSLKLTPHEVRSWHDLDTP